MKKRTPKQESLIKWALTNDTKMNQRLLIAAVNKMTVKEKVYWSLQHSKSATVEDLIEWRPDILK